MVEKLVIDTLNKRKEDRINCKSYKVVRLQGVTDKIYARVLVNRVRRVI